MKRILLLLLVLTLSLSVLFGCNLLNKDDNQGTPNEDNNQTDGPSDETPDGGNEKPDGGDEVVDYLPDAVRFLHSVYKDAIKITARDFDVIGQVIIDGVKFPVTWTCDNDKISIRPSVSDATAYTVDLPSVNTEEFSYVLTATISDDKGNSEQRSYEFTVPVLAGVETELEEGVAYKISFNQLKLGKRLFALNKSQNDQNKFILATNDPKLAPDFYAEKVAEGGYKFYTEIDGVKTYIYAKTETAADGKVSKFVGFSAEEGSVFFYEECGAWRTNINGLDYGFGTYNEFDTLSISDWSYFTASSVGTSQFVAEFITSEYAETLAPEETPEVEEPADGSTLTITEANELGLKVIGGSKGKFYITGKVVEIKNTTYGNIYIADENGNKLYIYGTYDATGANRFDAMANQPKVGDTITIYGQLSNFNGEAQVKNGWVTSLVPGEGTEDHEHNYVDGKCECGATDPNYTPVDPQPPVTGVPEIGKGHTISANNANGPLYFDGTVTSGRFNGSADASKAAIVYIENAANEGEYLLYFFIGDVKNYIVMDDKSAGGSFATSADSATVFEWNADKNTFAVAEDSNNRAFGCGATSTYTNFSAYDLTGDYNWGQFTPVDGGDTPVDPQPPVHEHNFVEGKCECGETDPNYVPPTVDPVEPTYTVVTELKTGDKIIIGAPAYGKLLSMVKVATYYNKGVNYTATDFSNVTDDEIFVVTVNEDGSIELVSVSGKVVAIGGYSSLDVAGANKTWTVEAKAGAEGIVYLKNNGTGKYLEWYASKDNWSSYAGTLSDLFELSFYLYEAAEGGEDTPVDPQPPVHEHNFVEGKCECGETDPNYVPPTEEKTVITITEALAIATAQGDAYTTEKYYISGIVTKISNTFFGNFYLVDAEGNELYVYGLKDATGAGNFEGLNPQPAVGDTLTIYTVLGCYQGAPQAKDAWFYELVKHTEHTYAPATCKVAATCTICGKTDGEPLEHTYVDGACTGCGKAQPAQGTIITSTEDFAGLTKGGSYLNHTTTSGWTATNAAVLVGGATEQNPVFPFIGATDAIKAITLRGTKGTAGVLTSATISNGISKLSFNYGHAFSDKNGVDLTINILKNGEVVATTRLDNDSVTQKTAYTFTWELDTAIDGDIVIEIVNNGPSNATSGNKDRVSIFNISWDSAPIVEG